MKITMHEYRPFEICKLTEQAYSATLFGSPVSKTIIEEDGTEAIVHEVDVLRSGVLPVSTLEEAEQYLEQNFESILAELYADDLYHKKLQQKEEAEQYLKSTDYRTLKAVREIPEIRQKLEELYPGEVERNRAAAEAVSAV